MKRLNRNTIVITLPALCFCCVGFVFADAPVVNETQTQPKQEQPNQHKDERTAKVTKEKRDPASEAEKQKMRNKAAHMTPEQRRLNVASQDEAGHAPRNRHAEMREKFRNMNPDERRLAMQQRKNQAIAERAEADTVKREQAKLKHQQEMLALKAEMKDMTPEQRKQFMRDYKKKLDSKTKTKS